MTGDPNAAARGAPDAPPRPHGDGVWRVRGIRGATTVDADDPLLVLAATGELLREIVARNGVDPDRLVSAIFTTTPDLASTYPARAARDLGWHDVPLLCMTEIDVPGGIPRCIRVLVHAELRVPREGVRHVYLHGARVLRPDWVANERGGAGTAGRGA